MQIDALKKELAMRDNLIRGGGEPWLAELSQGQSRLASRTAYKLLRLPNGEGLDSGAATSDYTPELHSVAFARHMLDFLVRVAWECSSGDAGAVKRAATSVLQSMHPEVPVDLMVSGLVNRLYDPRSGGEIHTNTLTDMTALSTEAASHSEPSVGIPTIPADERTSSTMTFEEFRGTKECLPLQEAYESSKAAIKHNKTRQIELVNVVNGWKQRIDATSEITKRYKRQQKRLSEGAVGQDEEPPQTLVTEAEFESAVTELEASKLGYRQAHAELQALRQEAEELAVLKRQALEEIASAYQIYVNPLS
jgi:hypothetical protein